MADSKIQEEARLRYPKVIGKIIATGDLNDYRRDAFIAGAEWQKEQKQAVKDPFDDEQFRRGYEAGKHDAEREQKPAEWSEEDEAMIKSILYVLESYVSQSKCASSPSLITTYPTYYMEIDWLKSLRPQPHWKPSEQAEKDLALTSEDIEKIVDIHRDVLYDNPKRIMGAKENYEDTLRKFNEWREKK